MSFDEAAGTKFTGHGWSDVAEVTAEEIPLPMVKNADAIWGALGRDDRGHIWVGVSGSGFTFPATLYEYNPNDGSVTDRGNARAALKQAGFPRERWSQVKLHSKIHQAADGYLYFTTLDEAGENAQKGTLPKQGSHVWRIAPQHGEWEHVLTTPEALIALNAHGRWVFALGYWDHVLYRYDTQTGERARIRIGASCGHVSRNFLVDARGHAYVPSVSRTGSSEPKPCKPADYTPELVEVDRTMTVVGRTPLDAYLTARATGHSHGIVSFTPLADETFVFTTHRGMMYHVIPADDTSSLVLKLGHLHPDGERYTPSLFSPDGQKIIAGISYERKGSFAWVRAEMSTGRRTASLLTLPTDKRALLYGSMVRDNAGNFYVGGRIRLERRKHRPLLLRLRPSPGALSSGG